MAQLDLTAYDPVLKETFSSDFRDELVFNKKNKLFSMLKKDAKKGQGDVFEQPIGYSTAAGTHNTFAEAKANYVASKYKKFLVPRAKVYKFAKIENEVIRASADDIGAFKPAISEIEKCYRGLGDYWEQRLFRSSNGAIGTIATGSNVTTKIATLTDQSDVHNFVVGQVCNLVSSAGSLRTGTLTVASINRSAGIVTFVEDIDDISGAAVTDYIVTKGDWNLAPYGLMDWVVPGARTGLATTFCNVDRSADADRLAGLYYDGSTQPMNEALIDGLGYLADAGADGAIDGFVNPRTATTLFKLLEGKATISNLDRKVSQTIGFPGFNVVVGDTTMRLYTSRNCQRNYIWGLTMDTWQILSAGENPSFLMERAGSMITPSHDFDGFECSMGGYANLSCSAPGLNICIKVAG